MERDENGWYPIKYDDCVIHPGMDVGEIPEAGTTVLVFNAAENEVCLGYLWRGDGADFKADGDVITWQPWDNDCYTRFRPTHWQPFPAPPIPTPDDDTKTE